MKEELFQSVISFCLPANGLHVVAVENVPSIWSDVLSVTRQKPCFQCDTKGI